MRVDFTLKYIEKNDILKNALEKNIQRITRRVKIFRKDSPIHVSIHLEKNPNKEQYFCRSYIYLPHHVVAADEKAANAASAMNKAFSAIARQLDKLKYRIETSLRRGKKKLSAVHRSVDSETD
ncbi:MAG: HPF/RaiA family ribosome-associated protein [Candidatus Omnitrophica bacterium]|nr:HPF/RaiA family ribosome-associated protein [Candidatus Omnitrophota bacterium]